MQSRLLGLVEREVLVRRPESRFSGDVELAFRHVLLREGAYAMLTDGDRTLGHRLAGEWLERAGEREPKLLAEHFDRGGEQARAAAHYLHAAEQALEAADYQASIKLSERGIALGREPELLAGLWAVTGEARSWIGDLEGAVRAAREAQRRSRPGSRNDCRALLSIVAMAGYSGDADELREPMDRLLRTEPEPEALGALSAALFWLMALVLINVQRSAAERCLRRLEQVTSGVMEHDAMAAAWVELARAMWACHAERDAWGQLVHSQTAVRHYERSGAGGYLQFSRPSIACSYAQLGLFDRGEEELLRTLASVPAGGPDATTIELNRAVMFVAQGKLEEAFTLAARIAEEAESTGQGLISVQTHVLLSELHLHQADVGSAEAEALAISEAAAAIPYAEMWNLAVLARIRLVQGRAGEASEIAERALSKVRVSGVVNPMRYAMLLLVRAEALHALGDHAAACQAIHEAQGDLLRRAAKIPDPEIRRSFLDNFSDHRRTLELAREWLTGEVAASPRDQAHASRSSLETPVNGSTKSGP